LALIAVAIMAPTSRKAARPANRWQASPGCKGHHEHHDGAHDAFAVFAEAEGCG
jgi:hypothetical protein